MADPETELSLPIDVASQTTAPASFNTLKQFSLDLGRKAFEAANAVPSPPAPDQATVALPKLTESSQTGYTGGRSKAITCCTVGAFLIEKNTAYDFIMMSNAASKNGVTLKINSAFRTMEEQTQLFNERKNPVVAALKGIAAAPGTSNHQSGIAIDIDVGMTKSDYIAKRYSATYLWLVSFSSEFGFDHAEGAAVNEPWHWTHLPTTIVGVAAFKSATGLAVLTSDTAVAAAASDQSGTQRLTNLEGHDDTMSLARATSFSQSSRQTILAERSIFSANSSNYVSSRVSQLQASILTLEVGPQAFDAASLNPLVYNFATGTWGDKKTV